ncbi:MAG: protease inhibitor I42 family protein [Archangium sp.]|nr:protease inhibitor I42 family protein [Archangium sp.]MDP3571870.1 protease inhibitor I42 family protein [Archangium sp.]
MTRPLKINYGDPPQPKETALAKKKAKPAAAQKKAKPAPQKKVQKPAKVLKSKGKAAKPEKAPPPPKAAKLPPPEVVPEPVKLAGKGPKGAKGQVPPPSVSAPPRRADGWLGPMPDKPMPRSTKLPPEANLLTKREMEQALTVGERGVIGEGSMKGKLVLYQGFPYLEVIGRDKRELWFLLQGPDQEVLPAYADHKVSVSGLVKRFHNYGGSVDVRKYSAKKPEAEVVAEVDVPEAVKLRLLSPGEVATIANPGMSVGVKGFATLRGRLEMNAEEYYLVVSNPGTRQQVAFTLEGKASKGLKKYIGEVVVATGVVEKSTGWGGRIVCEICEPRAPEYPPVARETIEVVEVEASGTGQAREANVKLNHGLTVKLPEKQGHVWAIEPQTAKRVSLREVNVNHPNSGSPVREFFFTPRNPGMQEIEFFLGKVHNPMQVARTFKVIAHVKSPEVVS